MRFTRRRSDRPDASRGALLSSLEALERREVLSAPKIFSPWLPTDLPVYNPVTHEKIPFSIHGLVNQARQNPQAQFLSDRGKVVSGKDRQRNEWTITVHGPGAVIVTDSTPNDGMLDDDIDTIQIIGSDPHRTYVTGSTTASAYTPTDGTVLFNKLLATNGVHSIVLNGFTLTQTVLPPNGGATFSDTGVFLLGGVGLLQFHDILGSFNLATAVAPINLVIGDPSTALTVAPTIRLDSIFNTVFDTNAATVPTDPRTTASVNILVNGQIKELSFISSTQHPYTDPSQEQRGTTVRYTNPTLSPIDGAGNEFNFPIVGTTGRTAVRAIGIGHFKVKGSPVNVTASRGATPFQNGLSGLDHIGAVSVGGNADALGLDVNGPIQKLHFKRGLGSPVGAGIAATQLGIPSGETGYPASGLQGGLVTATDIGHVRIKPANQILLTSTNPDFVQLYRTTYAAYFPFPGNALTSSSIVSSGSIGKSSVQGNLVNSEIKSGFHYPSFAAGLEGTRAKSRIGRLTTHGDLVNGDVSATYRPGANGYGSTTGDVAGPGTIVGNSNSSLFVTGGVTPLNNTGAGYFARTKRGGYLPPPETPKAVNSILIR